MNDQQTLAAIADAAAKYLDTTVAEMKGDGRTREVADARKVYFRIARQRGVQLGAACDFLGKHHSAGISAQKAADDLMAYDERFVERVRLAENHLSRSEKGAAS